MRGLGVVMRLDGLRNCTEDALFQIGENVADVLKMDREMKRIAIGVGKKRLRNIGNVQVVELMDYRECDHAGALCEEAAYRMALAIPVCGTVEDDQEIQRQARGDK
jgi:bacterioferritin (cytochrome b1)